MAGPPGDRKKRPATDTDVRASERPEGSQGEFPIRLIPIMVPALAVLLATVVYFLMGEIL